MENFLFRFSLQFRMNVRTYINDHFQNKSNKLKIYFGMYFVLANEIFITFPCLVTLPLLSFVFSFILYVFFYP
jgi:hypothetical protein